MENFSSEVCILCRKGFDVDVNRVSVTNKGLQSIAEFSERYMDVELLC